MSERISHLMMTLKDNVEDLSGWILGRPNQRLEIRQSRIPLSPASAILLAISFGLCAGYLDLVLMLCKKLYLQDEWIIRFGRDFPWTVPVAHAVLLLIPGMVLAVLSGVRPRLCSLRGVVAVRDTRDLECPVEVAALWCLHLFSSDWAGPVDRRRSREPWLVTARGAIQPGRALRTAGCDGGFLVGPAGDRGTPHGRRIAATALRGPQRRAHRLGHSPRLRPERIRLSAQHHSQSRAVGARAFGMTSPWRRPMDYPSHSCFFTGQWPFQLNSQWRFTLDTPHPTLAEYVASRGYQTAGFAANTNCCNYETGLARGFAHFEDFPLNARSLFGRTAPGNWILKNVLYTGLYHDIKWIGLRSRGAYATSDAFLSWLRRRRTDRPFFAFINYFDAHAPYIPPPGYAGRFGIRPKPPFDYNFLLGNMTIEKNANANGPSRRPAIATTIASLSSTNNWVGCWPSSKARGFSTTRL